MADTCESCGHLMSEHTVTPAGNKEMVVCGVEEKGTATTQSVVIEGSCDCSFERPRS